MAKVTKKELNECIAEAISQVLKEDWEDDIVNAAMNDKRAKAAFKKDKKKEDDAEAADDAKNAAADANDAPVADDEEGGEEAAAASNGAYSDVRGLSYEELKNILQTNKRGTAIFRAATRELMDRNAILKDKNDILNGELVMPYGWKFDEKGYPVRTHEFKHADMVEFPDAESFQGLNHHWLKPQMNVRGEEIKDAGVGMPDANFWEAVEKNGINIDESVLRKMVQESVRKIFRSGNDGNVQEEKRKCF